MTARNVTDPTSGGTSKLASTSRTQRRPHTDPFSYTRGRLNPGRARVAHRTWNLRTQRVAGFGGLILIFAAISLPHFFLLLPALRSRSLCRRSRTLCCRLGHCAHLGRAPWFLSAPAHSLLAADPRTLRTPNPNLLWWDSSPHPSLESIFTPDFAPSVWPSQLFLVENLIENA